jgi:hypothetical protein
LADFSECKIVDDQNTGFNQLFNKFFKRVGYIGSMQSPEKNIEGVEGGSQVLTACSMSKCQRKMCFPGTGGTEKEDIFSDIDEAAGSQLPYLSSIDGLVK